jgi:glutamine amidotransferase
VTVIIDYGMGNLGSIQNMLKKIGSETLVSSDISDIKKADKLILPGVGSFDAGMRRLAELRLIDSLHEKVVKERTQILGICLGMHLLCRKSQEGNLPGLEWIDAEVKRFNFGPEQSHLKVPHMGWNRVRTRKQDSLFEGLEDESRFYFIHSYHVVCNNIEDELTLTFHGYDFASSIKKDNIVGVQFHPEKSHKFGMKFLKNFLDH